MPRTHRAALLLFALFFTGLTSSCSFERMVARESRPSQKHGACVSCHRTNDPASAAGTDAFAGGLDPSASCLDCHHYDSGHHPVEVTMDRAQLQERGDALPFFDGRVRCLTCHQAHKDPQRNVLAARPMLLRGGPYPDQQSFCLQCHRRDNYVNVDPHKMLLADGTVRQVNGSPVCLLCHTTQPDPTGDPDTVEFRADVAFLCWRCHEPMEGSFLKNHFHVKPKKQTTAALRDTEDRLGISLPLFRDGMVTCSTCHNPHQTGVITRTAARAGADAPQRLRIAASSICLACHAK